MNYNDLRAAIALQSTPNIGDVNAKKLIAHCGSPEAIFKERKDRLLKIDGIGAYTIAHLFDSIYLKKAEEEIAYIEKYNIKYHFFSDEDYPVRLKHCIDSPILLFRSGNIDLKGKKILSIVGTRKITNYGMSFCERLLEELAPLDPIIVSGFAYGVDITAQKAASRLGMQTIGCLAHGLNQTYPKIHTPYRAKIEKNGGFLTEFHSTSQPDRENFLKRNRIIAGISEATVVIESAEKGGSLVTAAIANSYNKDVFAVPGRSEDKFSVGCNNLIKMQKAQMLTCAADLVYLLGWDVETIATPVIQKQLFEELNTEEQKVYSFLMKNGKELLDLIALECKLPIHKVSSLLLGMELKGVVRPLPGKLFEAV
ncbi:DNA-processing protein DprA [Ascidiimonas sp. W6]|uniref:DNA-processing protein DprA n=1 Tax=Ascidiimonas meishanensis TaxID=3128903 RepID=UPI0030EDE43B